MPTPANVPATTTGGREVQNPALFAQLTERQQMPQTPQAFKGLGKSQRLVLEKVGVVARVRLLVTLKYKTAAGQEPIPNPGFPFKILRELALQANGVTGIIDVPGVFLQNRLQRILRNPASAAFAWTGEAAAGGPPLVGKKLKASTNFTNTFVIEVPIAHDMLSLIGALLAQNEETQLSILLNWASEEELVSGGKIEALEGEIEWHTTTFSIGSTPQGNSEVTVLPDLSAFHGLIYGETPIQATGLRRLELIRTAGQLLAETVYIANGAGGTSVLSPAEWTRFALEYGGNKDPLVWVPALELLEENANDYNGALNTQGITMLCLDNERDNPSRDMVVPESLTELRAVVGVPAAFVPSAAAAFAAQETLYPAV